MNKLVIEKNECFYNKVVVAGVSNGAIVYMAMRNGYVGIWIALTIYMSLRATVGIVR